MKEMSKKHGLRAALSAVLLLTAVLVIGCPDPYTGSSSSGYKPPAGMGAVQLKLVNSVGKTILPSAPAASSFTWYRLTFTPTLVPGTPEVMWKTNADISTPIPLLPEEYTLEVIAYHDASADPLNATPVLPTENWASYTTTAGEIVIAIGTPVTRSIALTLVSPTAATEDGTFAWDFDFSAVDLGDLDTGSTMTITAIGGSVIDTVDLTVSANLVDSSSIEEGYYFVDLNLILDSSESIAIRQILQVYRYLTSTYTQIFTNEYFGGTSSSSTENLTLNPITVTPIPNNPPDIIINTAATGAQYITSLTTEATGLTATVNGDGATALSRVSLTLSNDTDYDAFQWYCDSTLLGSAAIQLINTLVTDPFNDGTDPVPGIYYVTVIGWAGGGIGVGVPHASMLTVIVTP